MSEGVGRSQSLLSVPAGWWRWFDVGANENGKPFMYKANHAVRAAVGTRKMCGFVRLAVTAECSVFLV